jgi:hypothetical protein
VRRRRCGVRASHVGVSLSTPFPRAGGSLSPPRKRGSIAGWERMLWFDAFRGPHHRPSDGPLPRFAGEDKRPAMVDAFILPCREAAGEGDHA